MGITCLADPQLPWLLGDLEAGPVCFLLMHRAVRVQGIRRQHFLRSYDGWDRALCIVLFLIRNWVNVSMGTHAYSLTVAPM